MCAFHCLATEFLGFWRRIQTEGLPHDYLRANLQMQFTYAVGFPVRLSSNQYPCGRREWRETDRRRSEEKGTRCHIDVKPESICLLSSIPCT
jgi:hypothetical protein